MKKIKGDHITKNLFTGAVYIMIMIQVSISLSALIDGLIISRCLGGEAIAASGLCSPYFDVISVVAGLIAIGGQTICAKNMGVGRMKEANRMFSMICVVALIASVIITIPGIIFADKIAIGLGARGNAANLYMPSKEYLVGLFIGTPAYMFVSVLTPFLHLDGDKFRAAISLAAMAVIDIAGDFANVYIFHKGMFGMGIATSFGYIAALIIAIFHFKKKDVMFKFSMRSIVWSDIKELMKVGLPTANNRLSGLLRKIVMNYMVIFTAASTAMVAQSILGNIRVITSAFALGVGATVLLIAGVIVGEEDRTNTKNLLNVGLRVGLYIMGGLAVVLFVAAPAIAKFYVNDPKEISLTVAALRWFAVSMPLNVINQVFINYTQGIHNLKLTNVLTMNHKFACSVVSAFVMAWLFGINGIWASAFVNEVLVLLIIVIWASVKKGKLAVHADDYLFLPEQFGVADEDKIELSIQKLDQVMNLSKEVSAFCISHGVDKKRTYLLALFIEEMGGNIVEYGFDDGKPHSIDLRVLYKDDDLILRMRDDCRAFDLRKQVEMCDSEDLVSNIGIRMVLGLAKDVTYVNTMRTNNLTIKI